MTDRAAADRNLLIVTGASSGIGLAIAAHVPFPARTVDISRSGPPADSGIEHVAADLGDVASWSSVSATIATLVAETDPVRAVLVHAAGTLAPIGFAGEVDTTDYVRNVLLNSAAGQVLGHAFLAALAGRRGSHDLIMISSGAASKPYAGWSAYGAGKAALDHWVRIVGEEQRLRGHVRVAAIAPGVVATAMQSRIRTTAAEDFPSVERFRRLYDEEALAAPEIVAQQFWRVVEAGVESGGVLDLRDG